METHEKQTESNLKTTAVTWKEEADRLWALLKQRQGETFYTAKRLPFTYVIRGGELFVDRRLKSITRATFDRAVEKLVCDRAHEITGPKALCCFGAPYLWALYQALRQEERAPGGKS